MIEYRPKPSARGRKKAPTATTASVVRKGKKKAQGEIDDAIEDDFFLSD